MNFVKCSRCGMVMIAEKFDDHECQFPLGGVKIIPVAYIHQPIEDRYSRLTINARGLDGVHYSFVVIKERYPTEYVPSDENE